MILTCGLLGRLVPALPAGRVSGGIGSREGPAEDVIAVTDSMTSPQAGSDTTLAPDQPVQVGILTEGKATLAMVLVGLVLQESVPLDIYIVDTAESAVIKR